MKNPRAFRRPSRKSISGMLLVFTLLTSSLGIANAQTKEDISREFLVNIARSQYTVLCGSEIFKNCMGFEGSACSDLAEKAIEQCLLPLPEKINPEVLNNSSIESCPIQVFEDAGFSEEQAEICLKEASGSDG